MDTNLNFGPVALLRTTQQCEGGGNYHKTVKEFFNLLMGPMKGGHPYFEISLDYLEFSLNLYAHFYGAGTAVTDTNVEDLKLVKLGKFGKEVTSRDSSPLAV